MHRIPDEAIIKLLPKSTSMKHLIEMNNMCVSGHVYKIYKRRIKELDLNTEHWRQIAKDRLKKLSKLVEIPLTQVMVENSTYGTNTLKKRLLKDNLLENKCSICGQLPEWNAKPLTLQLDHINGIRNDHRLENLRILCPHCHIQTETYGSKNQPKRPKFCKNCPNVAVFKTQTLCSACKKEIYLKTCHKTKIDWPSKNKLLEMLTESNYIQVAKKIGVSDNAIRKHLKNVERVEVVETSS